MLQQVASHCCYVIVAIPMYERGNERDSERDKIKGKRECCDIFWFTHQNIQKISKSEYAISQEALGQIRALCFKI